MIDDKKIEEGSKKFRQDFHEHGDRTQGFLVQFGFEAGAKWAINEFLKDLCHTIEEKPKKERVFLYKTRFGGYGINQLIDENEWKYIQYREVTQWLYVDDLFPKEEGEE